MTISEEMLFLLQFSPFPGPGQGQGERTALPVTPLHTDGLTSLSQVALMEPVKISSRSLLLEMRSKPKINNSYALVYS